MNAVIFDFYNTLFDFNDGQRLQKHDDMAKLLREEGYNLTGEEFLEKRINSNARARYFTGKIDMSEMVRELIEEMKMPLKEETLNKLEKMYREYEFGDTTYPMPGVPEALEDLEGDYMLGIVSNGVKDVEMYYLDKYNLSKYFPEEYVVVSSEVGIKKPDELIFEELLDRMDLQPRDTAYVGDELDHDVIPAKNCGMKTIHYTNNSSKKLLADAVVHDFKDIPPIVRKWFPVHK